MALGLRSRLDAAAPAARTRVLVDFILHQLRDELGIEGDDLHPRSRFESLGIDSKRALEFKELLDDELGILLRTTLMFDYPTPESLAAYIAGVVFPAPAAASDVASAPGAASAPGDGDAGPFTDDAESFEDRLRRKLASYDV